MATAIGGTNGLIDQLLALTDYAFSSNVSDPQRVDCLNAFNICEQLIAQSESLMYLSTEADVSLPSGQDYAAVPTNPAIDFGKDISLSLPGNEDPLKYYPPDKFAGIKTTSGYAITTTKPFCFTIVRDHAAAERRFKFKASNTTGGPLTLKMVAQRIPPVLTDAGGSTSMLPDGYELTLLLPMAEEYLKSKRHEFGIDKLSTEIRARIAEFYNKERSNKEKALTDRGRERRKVDVTVADEGY